MTLLEEDEPVDAWQSLEEEWNDLRDEFISTSMPTLDLALGDIDRDGDLDLVVGNDGEVNELYENDGEGNFTLSWTSPKARPTESIVLGDFDGDSQLDLFVGNGSDEEELWNQLFINNGGTFNPPIEIYLAVPVFTSDLSAGDMDGDGDLDIALGNEGANRILENRKAEVDAQSADELAAIDESLSKLDFAITVAPRIQDLLRFFSYLDTADDFENLINDPRFKGNFAPEQLAALQLIAGLARHHNIDISSVDDTEFEARRAELEQQKSDLLNQNFFFSVWESDDTRSTFGIAWGDVDNDGDLDLAIGNADAEDTISEVLRNDGNRNYRIDYAGSTQLQTATSDIAWADVNGDGLPDYAVANWDAPVQVYTGTDMDAKPPKFEPAWAADEVSASIDIEFADIDGDGSPDLIVGNFYAHNQLYLNDGEGNFYLFWESPDEAATTSIAVADWNDDQHPDLVVGNWGSANQIFENIPYDLLPFPTNAPEPGAGTSGSDDTESDENAESLARVFTDEPAWQSLDQALTQSVAWGEWDSGRHAYLAVGNEGGPNQVFEYRNGSLLLQPEDGIGWRSADSNNTTSVAWSDWDDDGDLDLLVGNMNQPLQLFETDTISKTIDLLQPPFPAAGVTTTVGISGTVIAPQSTVILPDATEQVSTTVVSLELAWSSDSVEPTTGVDWIQWDDDDLPDLVVANYGAPNQVWINSNEGFTATINFGGERYTSAVVWCQLQDEAGTGLSEADPHFCGLSGDDADRELHLMAFANEGSNQIILNKGIRNGNNITEESDVEHDTRDVAWGDVDNDGDLDLAVANEGYNQVWINEDGVLKYADGGATDSFTSPARWRSPINLRSHGVAWGDVDGDGRLDLAVANFGSANRIYLNDEERGGLGKTPYYLSRATLQSTSLAWADFDFDGDLDLAIGNHGAADELWINNSVQSTVMMSLTQLSSSAGITISVVDTTDLAWGDMDDDGDLDLAVAALNAPNRVYENVGGQLRLDIEESPDGELVTRTGWLSGDSKMTTSLVWGDIDGDSDLDLVAGNRDDVNLIYYNNGAGDFVQQSLGADAKDTEEIALVDIDIDGDLDILVGQRGKGRASINVFVADLSSTVAQPGLRTDTVLLYRNNGRGLFAVEALATDANFVQSIAAADVNGDGDLDLALGNFGQTNLIHQMGQQGGTGRTNNQARIQLSAPVRAATRQAATPRAYAQSEVIATSVISLPVALFDPEGDPIGRVEAFYSINGGGSWQRAVPVEAESVTNLATGGLLRNRQEIDGPLPTSTISATVATTVSTAIELNQRGTIDTIRISFSISRTLPDDFEATLISPDNRRFALRTPAQGGTRSIEQTVDGLSGNSIQGAWTLELSSTNPEVANILESWTLQIQTRGDHIFEWDTFASGFFGQSDNVVVRMVAYPQTQRETNTGANSLTYVNATPEQFVRPTVSTQSRPFRVRGTQVRVLDEAGQPIEGAFVYRLPQGQVSGAQLMPSAEQPRVTNNDGFLTGRGTLQRGDRIMAMLPVSTPITFTQSVFDLGTITATQIVTDPQGITKTEMVTSTQRITGTNQIDFYYTSAKPASAGLEMIDIQGPGVIDVVIPRLDPAERNPLMLFNLSISAEWDVGDDRLFLVALEEGLRRASELLFDVTDGQVALGRIDVFPAKTYWNRTDITLHATNNLRPSAAIGGVTKVPLSETILSRNGTKEQPNAYVPAQVRMGTAWDPFGETAEDVGEQWWRAFAHELAHYLLFLPDNYVGFDTDGFDTDGFNTDGNGSAASDSKGILREIDCKGSFMTTTRDPSYTELLNTADWTEDCQKSLANALTGRTDWQTVTHFYPMLKPSTTRMEGPAIFPLDVTHMVPWGLLDGKTNLPTRNFDIRGIMGNSQFGDRPLFGDRLRLPTAQAYLIQTQGNSDLTDDVLIPLGSPTGGGDRIKVRGAVEGDQLCLYDFGASDNKIRTGCVDSLSAENVSIPVQIIEPDEAGNSWSPQIEVTALSTRTLAISVTQPSSVALALNVQVYPAHYPTAPGIAPTVTLSPTGDVYATTVDLPYPASDVFVRVWDEGDNRRAAITRSELVLPWGEEFVAYSVPDFPAIGRVDDLAFFTGGRIVGGPNSSLYGGPNSSLYGGPNSSLYGGPNSSLYGGPNSSLYGGSNQASFAPTRSSDAQVIIYRQDGLFEATGVTSLQTLPSPPRIDEYPWLVPVGQAYLIQSDETVTETRAISINYLQRDVPEGYEHTLAVYYLQKGSKIWQAVETNLFVENIAVAALQADDGVYAVMSTVELPELKLGWNAMTYPLPDSRPVTEALQSITYSVVYRPEPGTPLAEVLSPPQTEIASIVPRMNLYLRDAPGLQARPIGFLRRGERAQIIETDPATNWHRIACPTGLELEPACWVSGSSLYSVLQVGNYVETENVDTLLADVKTNVERLEFGEVYWIKIEGDEPVTPFLAPPRRTPDGVVPGSE